MLLPRHMQPLLFISDLHLSAQKPLLLERFRALLEGPAREVGALYILGDLFDAWVGDDDPSPFAEEVRQLLRRFTGEVPAYLQHGNRDFLLGERFAGETGIELLPEEISITIAGEAVLLLHGDQLCSDDLEYQQARKTLRDPAFIREFLSRSIPERLQLAAEYRRLSGEAVSTKAADIMDVNQDAVERTMRKHGVRTLIHGHTHRPAMHEFELDGQPARRIVLPDWRDDQVRYLMIATPRDLANVAFLDV